LRFFGKCPLPEVTFLGFLRSDGNFLAGFGVFVRENELVIKL
jgi:hypothetical protein